MKVTMPVAQPNNSYRQPLGCYPSCPGCLPCARADSCSSFFTSGWGTSHVSAPPAPVHLSGTVYGVHCMRQARMPSPHSNARRYNVRPAWEVTLTQTAQFRVPSLLEQASHTSCQRNLPIRQDHTTKNEHKTLSGEKQMLQAEVNTIYTRRVISTHLYHVNVHTLQDNETLRVASESPRTPCCLAYYTGTTRFRSMAGTAARGE